MKQTRDSEAYRRLTGALRRQRRGVTAADMVAGTALPLETVRELLPRASDEYRGRLEVTESGEILYSFPHGFVSRYRSFPARLRQTGEKLFRGLRKTGAAIFKVWIVVMLVGYFLLFMLIALAALVLSVVSVSKSNSDSRSRRSGGGGMYFAGNILNLIIRLWFYSELFKPRYVSSAPARSKGKPLHRAVFSFVFGDGDPNSGWPVREQKAVIAHIQANRGVISLPEFMALTGLKPEQAENEITAYCVRFGGLPEATEAGTVVYRFDPLMLKTDAQTGHSGSTLKKLWNFSSNSLRMNQAFALINGVNLAFGGYFLYCTLNLERLLRSGRIPGFRLFAKAYSFFYKLFGASSSPWDIQIPFAVVLGLVPLVFSVLFWLIPALRHGIMGRNNEKIKLENFRKTAYSFIWNKPLDVKAADLDPAAEECRPRDLPAARDRIIKEIGAYAVPEVSVSGRGDTVYAFTGLKQEREALDSCRSALDAASSSLGKTVFDSGS
ncbi:MAG: hypothetical protein LBQ14_12605 [Treponema sp.]|jgi:hypothetical protein|nr:hypothetical protein [Treponema sp.]